MTAWWEENAKEKQEKFQDRILSWNNSIMDFEEGRISARGTVEITADDWGVKIIFTSESFVNQLDCQVFGEYFRSAKIVLVRLILTGIYHWLMFDFHNAIN